MLFANEEWRFIIGYTIFFGDGTSNKAEFLALLEGLRQCQAMELQNVCIEGDSSNVVSAIQREQITSWNLVYDPRKCLQAYSSNYTTAHVFRQKNMLADWAHEHQNRLEIYRTSDLSVGIRKVIRGDQMGIGNYR